ncbi:MAG: hypothetical protein H0U59_06100 [Gemmatimonadaceae bacterium]|nr:hypothetical protein [Gemmatimonadaceae bacterium]
MPWSTPVIMPDPYVPDTVEGLGSSGPMGGNPALSIAGIMSAVTLIVAFLATMGVYEPSPEVRAFFEQYGVILAGLLIAAIQWLQGWITRNKVFSPATVAEDYVPR